MRPVPARRVDGRIPFFITPGSESVFGLAPILADTNSTGTGNWPAANKPLLIPFRVSTPFVVTHLGWFNGTAAGSNHDIGIYTSALARVVSAGSTGGSGNSSWQWVDVTDTALAAGDYFLVKALDATTANRSNFYNTSASAALLNLMGVKESTDDSIPLPSSLTNVVVPSSFTRIPQVAMLTRAPF